MADRLITKYQVVRNHNHTAFHEGCNGLLREGWQPLGGVAIQASGDRIDLAQAFVKYAD